MSVGIAEQRSIIIRNLPAVMNQTVAMIKRGDRDLMDMFDSRLTSGEKVFGDRILSMPEGELYHEGVEELVDALTYFCFRREVLSGAWY